MNTNQLTTTTNLENQLYDIYDIWYKPFWRTTWFYIVIVFCVFILLFFIVRKIYLSIKKRRAARPVPVWDRALAQIKHLQKQAGKESTTHKQTYFHMTELLKQYLHERFGYDLIGKTDDEMIVFLRDNGFDKSLFKIVQQILNNAQLVKFAQSDILFVQVRDDINRVKDIVEQTIPVQTKIH